MESSGTKAVIVKISKTIEQLKTAQAIVKDIRLALIRIDRELESSKLSGGLSSHIKQMEKLIKEHHDCVMFLEATSISLGSDDSNVEIVQGR